MSGVLKSSRNIPDKVVSRRRCRRVRSEEAARGEWMLTRVEEERSMSGAGLQAVVVGKFHGSKVLVPIVVVDGDKWA